MDSDYPNVPLLSELSDMLSISPIIDVLNVLGTAVFGLTGAISAARKNFDIFGMSFFAALVGLGGGTLRDVIIGRLPVFWVHEPWNIGVTTAAAFLAFFLMSRLERIDKVFIWADAVGLATFAIVGTSVALEQGVSIYLAPFFGMITACFGGMFRDVVANDAPTILYGELYASAAFAGGVTYVLVVALGGGHNWAALLGLIVGLCVRSLGIIWKMHLPRPKLSA